MTPRPIIPGTYVFGIDEVRKGFALNAFCASLSTADNRARFVADEGGYCDQFPLSPDQRRAVLERDWKSLMDLGASIFHVYKLARVDNRSMQYLGGVFTGMSTEDFRTALLAGGRHFG